MAEGGVVLLVCALFATMVISFARNSSATYDEVAHLPAGCTYFRWHDYRLNPEHPPLVKELAALPLWLRRDWPMNVDLSGADPVAAGMTSNVAALRWSWAMGLDLVDEEWSFGHDFLYGLRPEALPRLQAQEPGIQNLQAIPPMVSLHRQDFYNHADEMLFWGRLPVMLLGVALALLIFFWSRELFGFAGGVLSLALFCFDPNFIAHSGLVTTDVGESLFMAGAIYFLWRCSRRWSVVNLVLFLLFFGLAFAAKFSAVLLLPMFWLATAGWLLARPAGMVAPEEKQQARPFYIKAGQLAGLFAAGLLAAYVLIWAVYSFRYSAAADPRQAARAEAQILAAAGQTNIVSLTPYRQPGQLAIEGAVRGTAAVREILRAAPGQPVDNEHIFLAMNQVPVGRGGRLILFAQHHELLPEAFLFGFAHTQMRSHMRASFLLGEHSTTGFRRYFFYAVLLKTPLPGLLLILTSLILALVRRRNWSRSLAFLILPAGFYFGVAVVLRLDIGQRHLLPIYPLGYVLAGSLALEWKRFNRPVRLVSGGLVGLWIMLASQFVFFPVNHRWWQTVAPYYLAYFNELAGGPVNGYKELVDSNLDWGQDLQSLKYWLDRNKITEPIYLCYFGMADPRYYGILHHNLPGGYLFEPQEGFDVLKPGGLIAISATSLQGVYVAPEIREVWRQILEHSVPVDRIGNSIFIYQFKGFTAKP